MLKLPLCRVVALVGLASGAWMPAAVAGPALYGAEDVAVCTRTFRVAADRGWGRLPIDQVVVAVARSFVGLPYKAKGLERPGDESLIVDFSGLDCTTFVESSLALARCIRLHQPTFAAFERELTAIRYRDGRIDQYPSRLHYFSDWIHEGDRQGRVDDVTAAIGGTPHPLRLTFMTLHPQAYQALRNPAYVTAMQAIEKTISARPYHFLPKQAIPKTGDRIHPGDVIAITTNVPGLDISHVGFAVTGDDGNLHLLHAPALGRKIEITREPLAAAIAGHASQTGIMVARPLEPVSGAKQPTPGLR